MTSLKSEYDIAVIGGGIAGCSIAYYLAKSARKTVVVLEMSRLGGGGTGQSAAMVMLQTNDEILTRLAIRSRQEYEAFASQNSTRFSLFVTGSALYATSSSWQAVLTDSARIQEELGVPTRLLSGRELKSMAPWMQTDDILIATYVEGDGYVDQWALLEHYIAFAEAKDVDFALASVVTGIVPISGGGYRVISNHGEITARTVVNAAGQFAPAVARYIGIDMPPDSIVCNQRHLGMIRPRIALKAHPILECVDDEWYMRPTPDGGILLGVGPTTIQDTALACQINEAQRNPEVLVAMRKYLQQRAPNLTSGLIPHYWAGVRGLTKDQRPIIGFASDYPGFFYCCGMSAFGITHSASCGEIAASLLLMEPVANGSPDIVTALSPSRFGL